jgi:hypothetical protein
MQSEFTELVQSFKALQLDYEKLGWLNTEVYARSCRALEWADKNNTKVLELLKAGENANDWAKHLGTEN